MALAPQTTTRTPGQALREDFPILSRTVHDRPLVYLDNAATTHKPRAVIEAVSHFYEQTNSNVHRGLHALSAEATDAYENARAEVARFVHSSDEQCVIFTRGTTECINLLAHSLGGQLLSAGDEVLITEMEHHSNIVPWQLVCEQTGAVLRVVPMNDRGDIIPGAFEKALSERTKIVSLTHVSNALGTVNPVRELVAAAKSRGAVTIIDGAQAIAHMPVNVAEIGCDFYAFSGHKMYGPTGIGVLVGNQALLEKMPPYQGGGEMIRSVTFEKTLYREPPARFEAGTPNIAGAVGLHAAMDYIHSIGRDAIARYEQELTDYAVQALRQMPGLRLIGEPAHRAGAISFALAGVHPHDIATVLDSEGVAIRAGHHCAQPVMAHYRVPATARASLAVYNTREDIHALTKAIEHAQRMFA